MLKIYSYLIQLIERSPCRHQHATGSFLRVDLKGEYGNLTLRITIDNDTFYTHIGTLGKTFLISNHPTKNAAELVALFRQQITIERAFANLKCPDFCASTDESIQGHLLSCVMCLLLMMVLVREVRKVCPEMSFGHIRESLGNVTVATVHLKNTTKVIRTFVQMPLDAQKLVSILHLDANR